MTTTSPKDEQGAGRRPVRRAAAAAAVLVVAVGLAVAAPSPRPADAAPGDHCFTVAAFEVFLGRAPTSGELATWKGLLDAGTHRSALPRALANSDEWLAREVTKIYQQALDRGPDAPGLAHWVSQLRAGAKVTRIASLVYGSPEFYAGAGGTPAGFVTDAYDRVLHRTANATDLAYWVGQLQTRTRGAVAADLVASRESRTDRVTALYQAVLGRGPDPAGLDHWVTRLAVINDVELAISLASSAEFRANAQQGCTEPPSTTFAFHGRGWGHGRGMGQWGALGYAVDHGWTGSQILDHFYGGTVAHTLATDPVQRVYLVGSAAQHLTVTQPAGRLRVSGHSTDYRSISVRRLSATHFRIYASTSETCNPTVRIGEDVSASEVRIASSVAQGEDPGKMLRVCRPDGTFRRYRGALRQVRRPGEAGVNNVAINEVPTESLLRGIVPKEVSPSWADAGGGKGAAAVRAQAVAARSYVLAGDTRWGAWATTCDTAQCQVYEGYGVEDARTDLAVLATARQVRAVPGGPVARTEFSSSTGGWTAGGDFPAVRDDGDDHTGNRRHTWTETRTATQVEAAFPGRGTFLGFDTFLRDGNGPQGGRIRSVRLRFSGGDVTRTGEQVRSALGLWSSWWAP